MGGVVTTMTMFKAFASPPWPDLGMNMLIISIILLLVGFWSIALATSEEVALLLLRGERMRGGGVVVVAGRENERARKKENECAREEWTRIGTRTDTDRIWDALARGFVVIGL